MKVLFLPEARDEFLDAISYYESAEEGLGLLFMEEVDRSVLWIAGHSELYRIRSGGYRRINLRAFPYYIPFVIRNSTLWILSVAHAAREPEYWIKRRPAV